MQVVRSIDTLLIVVIPMSVIFVMNAAIGIKICRYTGRTVDRQSSPSVAAAAVAADRRLGTASNSADDFYSNCSTAQKYQMRNMLAVGHGANDGANETVAQQQRHNLHVSCTGVGGGGVATCLLYTSPSPRDS